MSHRSWLTALCLPVTLAASASAEETVYLQLFQESRAEAPEEAETSRLLLAIGEPTVAAPIATWCESQRETAPRSPLPEALLRGAPYDRFATGLVPILLEVLIDDIEMRYALGTLRPLGASGLEFPFFELCAFGYGRREGEDWALDVLHLSNHRGDQLAVGLYKGILPEAERSYLMDQLGYSTDLPDPAGLLLMGQGLALETLLLETSPGSEDFDRLRRRIFR